jgi:hypothetical protein
MSIEIINHNINYLDQEEAVIKMFANIIGEPTVEAKREFYDYLQGEGEDVGPPVTDENVMEEIERSMWRFVNAKLRTAWNAWQSRSTAVAGPVCDQCGDAREAIGGRVCELCDLSDIDPAVMHGHCCCGGDDEQWETPSEEAERRQEMAENMERQMEEYERQCDADDEAEPCYPDLAKAIFEMNSVPTADPNVRVSYNVNGRRERTQTEIWAEIEENSKRPDLCGNCCCDPHYCSCIERGVTGL